jgi:hypothetical protein
MAEASTDVGELICSLRLGPGTISMINIARIAGSNFVFLSALENSSS